MFEVGLFAYAEAGEQCVEKVVGIGLAHNLTYELRGTAERVRGKHRI